MKAYTVHRLYVCQLTAEVIAQISFDEVALDKQLPTIEYADNYLRESKRQWFLTSLEKFINHKKQIVANSQVSEEKQKALNICVEAYSVYCNKTLDYIVNGFLKGKKYFEGILPHPSNNSFYSSQNNLNELIKFCEANLKK
jgi:hypothetical protein